ncbi:MAG: enoyl-CoA hydratase/isomerase family protein [Actinobacteria bacterium]|nr:MAG: enoyl-CoA hydratase/isomerase family protein [Actinomycetota bacterium]
MSVAETPAEERVHLETDARSHIAHITIDNQARRNTYDPSMRRRFGELLDEVAGNDDIKVLIIRGAGGVFTTGADMNNAYSWYDKGETRRPSQRRRLGVDRESFAFYQQYSEFPKVTVAQVETYALGGGFELALMSDITVVGRNAKIGMPGARLLGPALGNLHLFFYRLGPVLARRLLLTGDVIEAGSVEHLGLFTEVCESEAVAERTELWAAKVARMPADGLAIAKTGFNLVEQTQNYIGEHATGFLMHAFATNLRFEDDEFNFVKARAKHGSSKAFKLRDEHFTVDGFE